MSVEIFVLSILILVQWMFEVSNDIEDIITEIFDLTWTKATWGFGQMSLDIMRTLVFLIVADVYTFFVALRNKQFRLFVFPTDDTSQHSSSGLFSGNILKSSVC